MSDRDDIAIKVEGVYKDFDLPHEAQNSLKTRILHPMSKGKNIEKQHALKDISFEIKKGEFFGIVGRNGSGKSTLLKILAEIYTPTKGKVTVNGSLTPFIELGVGFNPELTGRENVYLNGAMLGFSTKEMEKIYHEIVEFAELEKFMDQKLKNYSSGMQVRLAFSVAIRAKSDILLLDEVLAVGDADFQRKCFDHLKKLKKTKRTVVFVSHDMSAVREYCDSAVLINNSKLIKSGTSDEVAAEYSKLFLENRVDTNQANTGNRWGTGVISADKIKVKINPEHITITQEISSQEELSDFIAGFRIRDASGEEVLGTNNKIENIQTGKIGKGSKTVLKWGYSNILSDGEYSVDSSIIMPDKTTVSDWWDDAVSFKVTKLRHLPYKVDPGFNLTVSKKDGK